MPWFNLIINRLPCRYFPLTFFFRFNRSSSLTDNHNIIIINSWRFYRCSSLLLTVSFIVVIVADWSLFVLRPTAITKSTNHYATQKAHPPSHETQSSSPPKGNYKPQDPPPDWQPKELYLSWFFDSIPFLIPFDDRVQFLSGPQCLLLLLPPCVRHRLEIYNNCPVLVLAPLATTVQTQHAELPGWIDAEHVEQRAVPVLVQHAVDPVAAPLDLRHRRSVQLGLRPAAAAGLWHGKTDFWLWFWRRKSDTTGRVHWKPIKSK